MSFLTKSLTDLLVNKSKKIAPILIPFMIELFNDDVAKDAVQRRKNSEQEWQ